MTNQGTYLWRLTPVARAEDAAWQGRKIWSEVEIVADSAGQALHLASVFDKREAGIDESLSQDRQQVRSGFEDAQLYRVDRLDRAPPADAEVGDVILARRA